MINNWLWSICINCQTLTSMFTVLIYPNFSHVWNNMFPTFAPYFYDTSFFWKYSTSQGSYGNVSPRYVIPGISGGLSSISGDMRWRSCDVMWGLHGEKNRSFLRGLLGFLKGFPKVSLRFPTDAGLKMFKGSSLGPGFLRIPEVSETSGRHRIHSFVRFS